MEVTKTYLIEQLRLMQDAYSEKRSDVDEIIQAILDGEGFKPEYVEHRYAKAQLPNGGWVEYDTLTTLFDYEDSEGKVISGLGDEYSDDDTIFEVKG